VASNPLVSVQPETLQVLEVDPQTDPRWEQFVASQEGALIYHHPAWLLVLEQTFGHKPMSLACTDARGNFRGILPLFRRHGLFTGGRLESLPHTPVAGPLSLDHSATVALLQAAAQLAKEQPKGTLRLKTSSADLDRLVDGMASERWEMIYGLELPDRSEEPRFGNSRNHARIKWAINKANKLGVRVRAAESETELRNWHRLYVDTMRFHATPPRPYRFFRICWDLLQPRGMMRLLLAEWHEAGRTELLAGSIFLMFGQTVFYAFNGRRRDTLSLRPNDAIQWQSIHDAWRESFHHYDFGEVEMDNLGLAEFKGKWGAEPATLYRYNYPGSVAMEPRLLSEDGIVRRLADGAWRRLSSRATALLGDIMFSHF